VGDGSTLLRLAVCSTAGRAVRLDWSPIAERYAVGEDAGTRCAVRREGAVESRRFAATPSNAEASWATTVLQIPDLASIQILSERSTSDSCAVALTVDDVDGDRYLVIRQLMQDAGEWRIVGGSEGVDWMVLGKSGPYLGVYAYANGRFFAGGRVQSGAHDRRPRSTGPGRRL
jgi:hypothetical protein